MASVRDQVVLLGAERRVPLRVLLVEDSQDDAALVQHLLRRGGYDLTCARVETAAAMSAALARESWDIVISDYALPEFSGPAALTLLQERGIDLPFIVVSGSIGEDVAVASMKAGAHDYVMKANLARLIPAIDRELRETEVRRERKRADEALRASEELFRSLVTNAHDSIIVADVEGNIRFANQSSAPLYGTDNPAELIGVNALSVLAEESRASARQGIEMLIRDGMALNQQYLLLRRDGTKLPIEITVSGLQNGSGKLSGFLAITRDISERKRAELELQRRFEQLQTVYAVTDAVARAESVEEICNQALDGLQRTLGADRVALVLRDPDGAMRFKGWRGLSECHRKVAERCSPWRLEAKDALPILISNVEEELDADARLAFLLAQGVRALASIPVMHQGTLLGKFITYYDQPRRFKSEEVQLAQAVASQIAFATEHRLGAEALRRSEERFALAVAGARDGIWDWSLTTSEVYVSPRLKKILGFEEHEIGTAIQEWMGRVHREDLAGLKADMRAHLEGRTPYFVSEHRLQHTDGTYRWVLSRGLAVRDASGKPERIAGSLTDITERKEAEAHLRLLETSVAHLNDMVVITQAGRRIAYINDAFERHTGFTRAEVVGATLSVLQGSDTDPETLARIRAALETGRPVREEILAYRKDGTQFWLEVDITPVPDERGNLTHWVTIARDITERKALEDQLRHSQKMEAVGRLAGGLAHDFNNQLTVIKGCAQFLLAALPMDDPSRRDAERISATVERGACLVRQLLAFSRRQAIATRAVNLTQLVSDTATMLRLLLGEQTDLRLHLAPDVWTVRADPAQIEQVLMNLVANAKDAFLATGSPGGTLAVETTNVEVDECRVSRGPWESLSPGHYVMFAVSDTGCGMTADVRQRIFEPFFTTKEPGKGTGLGLSTVYGIVKQHGGHIVCESDLGKGTAFRIYLPRDDGDERATSQQVGAAAMPGQPTRSRATVLVAEDEEGVREVVREALEKGGYAVRAAAGIEQALAVATQGSIHLLVTDLVMPDGSGPALARRLAQTNPTMRTLFMSGYFEETVAAQELSDANFLQKPFGVDDLLRKVHELLQT